MTTASALWTTLEVVSVTAASIDLMVIASGEYWANYGTPQQFQEYQEFMDEIEPIKDLLDQVSLSGTVLNAGKWVLKKSTLGSLKQRLSSSITFSNDVSTIVYSAIDNDLQLLDQGSLSVLPQLENQDEAFAAALGSPKCWALWPVMVEPAKEPDPESVSWVLPPPPH